MSTDVFDLADKIICITGGLGQLGRQFTSELLNRGASVAIIDTAVNDDCQSDFHDVERIRYYQGDVTSKQSVENILSLIQTDWGTPHGLINNAALDSPPSASIEENGPFETYPEESWDKVMEVNTKGVFLTCQIIGGAMAEKGRGAIINICSTYGLVAPDHRIYEYKRKNEAYFYKPVVYSASKSALLNLTRYVATYYAGRGVRANLITPGGVFNNQDEEFLKGYCYRVPLGRMANKNEFNGAIVFLLSDASSYMTGSNLVIDGGWTAW